MIKRMWKEFSFHTVFMKRAVCCYIPEPLIPYEMKTHFRSYIHWNLNVFLKTLEKWKLLCSWFLSDYLCANLKHLYPQIYYIWWKLLQLLHVHMYLRACVSISTWFLYSPSSSCKRLISASFSDNSFRILYTESSKFSHKAYNHNNTSYSNFNWYNRCSFLCVEYTCTSRFTAQITC